MLEILAFLLGFNPEELDDTKDTELIEYRLDMLIHVRNKLCSELKLTQTDLESQLFESSHALNLEISLENLMFSSENCLVDDECLTYFDIGVQNLTDNTLKIINVSINQKPSEIIREYFRQKLDCVLENDQFLNIVKDYEKLYVLNVCGSNNILYGNKEPIGNFKV